MDLKLPTGAVNRTITLNVKDNYGVVGTKTFVVSVCCSANGAGTLAANTTSVVHGTTAHTIAFTYTPGAGGMQSGAVTLDHERVPLSERTGSLGGIRDGGHARLSRGRRGEESQQRSGNPGPHGASV